MKRCTALFLCEKFGKRYLSYCVMLKTNYLIVIKRKKKMNIAFDIDGVLTDFEYFLDYFGSKYFSKIEKKKVSKVTASSSISERFGYSKEWERKFYAKYLFWYARKYPIRENAAETIRCLRKEGHKVYLITARVLANRKDLMGTWIRHCVQRWLKKNGVTYDGIYYVSLEDCAKEKEKLSRELKIDYFVEDEPKNIQVLSEICKVLCMSADYNEEMENCVHVIDFGEIYRIIQSSENGGFSLLDYKERDILGAEEKEEYFQKLKKYYNDIPFDQMYLKKKEKYIQRVVAVWKRLFKVVYPFTVVEGEIADNTKGCLFICNHRSVLDVPLCYCILNKTKARIITKREFEFSLIGNFMRKLGIIFLNREDKKSGKITQNLIIQTLLHGGNVLMFPEGTRNRTENALLPFKMGAFYMAQVTGAPIVPIVIRKNGRKYDVVFGEKVYVGVMDELEKVKEAVQKYIEKMYMKI